MVVSGCGLSVLLLPPGHVLFLALLSLGKVVGVLGLLQRMPVVQHPVWGNDLSLKRTSSGAHSELLGLVVLVQEQLALALQQELIGHSHVLDILVLVETVAHDAGMVAEDVPGIHRGRGLHKRRISRDSQLTSCHSRTLTCGSTSCTTNTHAWRA